MLLTFTPGSIDCRRRIVWVSSALSASLPTSRALTSGVGNSPPTAKLPGWMTALKAAFSCASGVRAPTVRVSNWLAILGSALSWGDGAPAASDRRWPRRWKTASVTRMLSSPSRGRRQACTRRRMEVRPTEIISAYRLTSSPTCTGLRKVMASTATVAQRPRARRVAARPAARSICHMSPSRRRYPRPGWYRPASPRCGWRARSRAAYLPHRWSEFVTFGGNSARQQPHRQGVEIGWVVEANDREIRIRHVGLTLRPIRHDHAAHRIRAGEGGPVQPGDAELRPGGERTAGPPAHWGQN